MKNLKKILKKLIISILLTFILTTIIYAHKLSITNTKDGNIKISIKCMKNTKATLYYGVLMNEGKISDKVFRWKKKDKKSRKLHTFILKPKDIKYTDYTYFFQINLKAKKMQNYTPYYYFKVKKIANKLYLLPLIKNFYITNITKNKATLIIETKEKTTARLYLYNKKSFLRSYKSPNKKRHIIKITNLSPENKYTYYFEVKGKNNLTYRSKKFYFKTAINEDTPFSFAIFGDSRLAKEPISPYNFCGVAYHYLNQFSKESFKKGADFILFSGDAISGYTSCIDKFKNQVYNFKEALSQVWHYIPIYLAVGNHEASSPYRIINDKYIGDRLDKNNFEKLWSEEFYFFRNSPKPLKGMPTYNSNVYSFNYGNSHFIVLNSDYFFKGYRHWHWGLKPIKNNFYHKIDKVQMKWLENDLKQTRKNKKIKYIFAIFHEPAYPTSAHYETSLDIYPDARDALWQLFDKYNITAVFNGHEHIYSRTIIDNKVNKKYKNKIMQIISGGTGAPFYPLNKKIPYIKNVKKSYIGPHYVIIKVYKDKVIGITYNTEGEIIDKFKIK